jgi:chromosome segregation ATPase
MAEIRTRFEENPTPEEIRELEAQKLKQIAELEAETKMWEQKMANRRPRDEDLQRIQELESEIRRKTDAIEATEREIQNMEANSPHLPSPGLALDSGRLAVSARASTLRPRSRGVSPRLTGSKI